MENISGRVYLEDVNEISCCHRLMISCCNINPKAILGHFFSKPDTMILWSYSNYFLSFYVSYFSSQNLSSQGFTKQPYLLLHKKTLCLNCRFSLGRNQIPFSLTTDHPWWVAAEVTQGASSFRAVGLQPPCWGCVVSHGSRWAGKCPEREQANQGHRCCHH